MHMKKEAVSGTEKVNQGLEVTLVFVRQKPETRGWKSPLSCETETREHLRGLDRRGLDVARGRSAALLGGLTALREA